MKDAMKCHLFVDTHVHFYPCYDLAGFLTRAFANFDRQRNGEESGERLYGVCLTERVSEKYFANWSERAPFEIGRNRIEPVPGALRVSLEGNRSLLYIIPSRQYTSVEGIELLALGSQESAPGTGSIRSLIEDVLERGGIPVLPWAPGKWMFRRGKILDAMRTQTMIERVFLGETRMQQALFFDTRFAAFRQEGFRVLAGSDPLPIRGESRFVGTYVTCLEHEIDAANIVASIKKALQSSGETSTIRGTRDSLAESLKRLVALTFRRGA